MTFVFASFWSSSMLKDAYR